MIARDWLLVLNQQHLERVFEEIMTDYNEHRLWSAIIPSARVWANLAHPATLGTADPAISEPSLVNECIG